MLRFRLADINELKKICSFYADAYIEYDFFSIFEPDEEKRRKFIYELYIHCISTNLRRVT